MKPTPKSQTCRPGSRVCKSTSSDNVADFVGLSVDQTLLQQKYNELSDAYRDKTNKHKQALQLYDALKKKYLVRDAQTAASANVNQTLQSIGSCTRPPAYQESLDPLQVYNDGIRQHKARSEHSSVQCMAAEQQRGRPPSETGDRQGVPVNMPPPPRPGRICKLTDQSVLLC